MLKKKRTNIFKVHLIWKLKLSILFWMLKVRLGVTQFLYYSICRKTQNQMKQRLYVWHFFKRIWPYKCKILIHTVLKWPSVWNIDWCQNLWEDSILSASIILRAKKVKIGLKKYQNLTIFAHFALMSLDANRIWSFSQFWHF